LRCVVEDLAKQQIVRMAYVKYLLCTALEKPLKDLVCHKVKAVKGEGI